MRAWIIALVVVLAACSSSKSSQPGTGNVTSTTSAAAASGLPDPCKALTDGEIKAALGSSPAPTPFDLGKAGGPQYRGCIWGVLTNDTGVVGVQISKPSG